MTIHKLVPLLALGLNLLLLGSALAADRRGSRNVVFAYLAACLALWNLAVFGLRWTGEADTALLWQRILHVGVIPIPVLFYHYVLVFLELPRRRLLVAGYALGTVFLAASATPAFIGGVRETAWGFVPAAGVLYAPFFVFFQSFLVLGLVQLVAAHRRQTSSVRRNRTVLVIVGVLVSLLGGAVDFARFILDWGWLYPIGIPTNAFFALALGVAIVRYRLMDVGTLVRRLVLYVATSAALAPVLFLGLYAVDVVLIRRPAAGSDELGLLVRDALMLLLVFTVALPLLRRLELALERLMFRRQHGVRDVLAALGRELPSLLDPLALARTLTEGLVGTVPARHASLHIRDLATGTLVEAWATVSPAADEPTTPAVVVEEPVVAWLAMTGRTLLVEETSFPGQAFERLRPAMRRLERSRTALLIPLLLDGELHAVLALGEKLSGEIYAAGEIDVLETLLGETAVALKNARLYQDLRRQMEETRRTQEQLFQTAKLAAVGEMAASLAHELNNPLMVILGHSGLLQRELPADSRAARNVGTIVAEANRAGKIVRDVLDFARRREPNREPVALDQLLDRSLALLEGRLQRARVEVARVFDGGPPLLPGDRDQLTQVFINLIGNAIDAMPEGGVLTIETGLHGDNGRRWAGVDVVDTGHGIPAERLPSVFEPFYTTKPEGAGTGLGLPISRRIVEAHGGTLDAESTPEVGTRMRVRLPLA